MASNKILGVHAREILGSDGMPALEAEVLTIRGTFRAVVSNVGPFDKDHLEGDEAARFQGKGLNHAVQTVLTLLGDKLLNKDPTKQEAIDAILMEDPTYPANAVLALSIACCKAGAKFNESEWYAHVAALGNVSDARIPMPWFNIVAGGNFANNELYPQSVSFADTAADSIRTALDSAGKIYAAFTEVCVRGGEDVVDEESGDVTLVGGAGLASKPNAGKLGALAPTFNDMNSCLKTIKTTLGEVGLGDSVKLSVNMQVSAYSSVIENEDETEETQFQYELSKWAPADAIKVLKNSGEMLDDYFEWLQQFPLVSIEDGFEKKDSGSLIALKEKVEAEVLRVNEAKEAGEEEENLFAVDLGGSEGVALQLVGNESISSFDDIVKAEEKQTVNAVVLSLAKAKTITNFIALNAKAESLGMPVIVSSEFDGCCNDVFDAHLAVGVRAAQFRGGGLCTYEFSNKYNELLRIAEEGEEAPAYIGTDFRK